MLHPRLAAIALTATALAVSGCGGSSGSTTSSATSTSSKPLTREELINQVDTICAHVNARRASTHYTTPQTVVSLAPQLASYEQAAAAELTKLIPPPSMASVLQLIATNTRALATDTVKLGEYAKSQDTAAANALYSSMQASHQQIVSAARENDFTECTKPS
jgi:hypothetical protein